MFGTVGGLLNDLMIFLNLFFLIFSQPLGLTTAKNQLLDRKMYGSVWV